MWACVEATSTGTPSVIVPSDPRVKLLPHSLKHSTGSSPHSLTSYPRSLPHSTVLCATSVRNRKSVKSLRCTSGYRCGVLHCLMSLIKGKGLGEIVFKCSIWWLRQSAQHCLILLHNPPFKPGNFLARAGGGAYPSLQEQFDSFSPLVVRKGTARRGVGRES